MNILYFVAPSPPNTTNIIAFEASNGDAVRREDHDLCLLDEEVRYECYSCHYHLPQSEMYKWSHKGDRTTNCCKKCWEELKS